MSRLINALWVQMRATFMRKGKKRNGDTYVVEFDGVKYAYYFPERPKPNPYDGDEITFLTNIKKD
jgi:hypothetical protein